MNFMGSDTVISLVAAEKFYGAKRAAGTSIPASEHSTITSWGRDAQSQIKFGSLTCLEYVIIWTHAQPDSPHMPNKSNFRCHSCQNMLDMLADGLFFVIDPSNWNFPLLDC